MSRVGWSVQAVYICTVFIMFRNTSCNICKSIQENPWRWRIFTQRIQSLITHQFCKLLKIPLRVQSLLLHPLKHFLEISRVDGRWLNDLRFTKQKNGKILRNYDLSGGMEKGNHTYSPSLYPHVWSIFLFSLCVCVWMMQLPRSLLSLPPRTVAFSWQLLKPSVIEKSFYTVLRRYLPPSEILFPLILECPLQQPAPPSILLFTLHIICIICHLIRLLCSLIRLKSLGFPENSLPSCLLQLLCRS